MEVLITVIKQENETKGVKIREEEVKPSLFSGNVILYLENPQDVFSLQEIINKFDKVAGYKITIHEFIAFLYTNNELSERKIKKKFHLQSPQKEKKYLGVNLIKEVKAFYLEKYETTMKELEGNKMESYTMFMGQNNFVKRTIAPTVFYRLNATPIKIPMVFFTELEQIISIFLSHTHTHTHKQNNKNNLEKE